MFVTIDHSLFCRLSLRAQPKHQRKLAYKKRVLICALQECRCVFEVTCNYSRRETPTFLDAGMPNGTLSFFTSALVAGFTHAPNILQILRFVQRHAKFAAAYNKCPNKTLSRTLFITEAQLYSLQFSIIGWKVSMVLLFASYFLESSEEIENNKENST